MRLEADAITIGIWYAWSCALLFVIGYSVLTPWWERKPGWVASLHGWAFIVLVTPFVIHTVWHFNTRDLWYGYYYAASFFVAGTVELVRFWLVYTLQPKRHAHRES